jgi:DNA (cytosine-5)-methyltransferase 1
MHGLIIDNFAGGGGASTGIEAALGRAVDIAINHDEEAIRMHEANHPGTRHIRNNIWQIDPRDVTGGKPVDLAWFSPDCKHFSKAKGGKPREKSIRDLAWVVVLWAQKVRPALILLENVEEFRTWGPLCENGFPIKERAGETFDKWQRELRKAGYKIQWKELRACDYGAPTIRKRFFMIARCDGKPIVWPEPTHGKPGSPEVLSGKRKPWRTAAEIIDWSIPCPSIFDRKKPLAEKTLRRIAHGIMKFVANNPSPFIVPLTHHGAPGRSYSGDQPLPTVTGANRGEMAVVMPHVTKFRSGAIGHEVDEPLHTVTANSYVKRPGGSAPLSVVEVSAAPFATYAQQGGANRSVEDPMHTVTASNKDQNCVVEAVVSPVIVGCGGRRGQSGPTGPEQPYPTTTAKADACVVAAFMQKFAQNGKGVDPTEPLHTVMAGAPRHAVVCAHLAQANSERKGVKAGRSAEDPLSTVTISGSHQQVVTSNMIKLRGTTDAHIRSSVGSVEEPVSTISAEGTHMGEIRAFLIKYYGNEEDGHGLSNPLGTVTVQDRFGLVIVTIAGEEYVIVDIGMRMLSPRELFNAQGFPADYQIEFDAHNKPITKTAQVAKCGNSVCPPLSEALVRANMADQIADREAVAA